MQFSGGHRLGSLGSPMTRLNKLFLPVLYSSHPRLCVLFSKLSCFLEIVGPKAYHSISEALGHIPRTAICTLLGLLEITGMIFGLYNVAKIYRFCTRELEFLFSTWMTFGILPLPEIQLLCITKLGFLFRALSEVLIASSTESEVLAHFECIFRDFSLFTTL